MRIRLALSLIIAGVAMAPINATAQTCTPEQFRKVVDEAGGVLRRLNSESQPGIQSGFRRLKTKFGWGEEDYVDKANALISDSQSEAYDNKAGELLIKLDQLAEGAPASAQDCARLGELEATALELQATIKVKTRYMLARIESQLGNSPVISKSTAAEPPSQTAPANPSPKSPPAAAASPTPPKTATATPPPAVAPKTAPVGGWKSSTVDQAVRIPPPASEPPPQALPQAPPMPELPQKTDGFSMDEIQEASKGYFGAVSTGLGSVIEHAFSKLGRPTAYVLGNEGGGAFIAGLRYGKGTLFTRGGRSREVYWHGPSIGYDFGAAGSKTLFLVYGLHEDLDIFNGFSGVDGSAYLVGGVGMTLLTDGKIIMAPIRSGVGLRIGASLGYVRFTAKPTWNPF